MKGVFKCKNPSKYDGNSSNIIYRSSWELTFMMFCDRNPSVVKWKSEENAIAYKDPVTGRLRRYFPDFIVWINKEDKVETLVVEIKPEYQTQPPKEGKNKKTFLKESMTYATNLAKWESARKWADNRGMKFVVFTEKHLGIASGRK